MDAQGQVRDDAPASIFPTSQRTALLDVGRALQAAGYRFVTPTPATHARVLSRPRAGRADGLINAFGWNRPFRLEELEGPYAELLSQGGLLQPVGNGVKSLVRFSTLGGMLFAHSAYPTTQTDAVFFGPDTYRYARAISWLADHSPEFQPQTIIDIGAGSGAGGIFAASIFPAAPRIVLSDINPTALAFAQINAALNGVDVITRQSDILAGVDGQGDLIISNPPYLVDAGARAYRHGGGDWGCALSMRILNEALDRLATGGRLLLYSGAPIVEGVDMFLRAAEPTLTRRVRNFRYEEQDPDVFGEELEHPPYDRADRIATVVLHVTAADIIR